MTENHSSGKHGKRIREQQPSISPKILHFWSSLQITVPSFSREGVRYGGDREGNSSPSALSDVPNSTNLTLPDSSRKQLHEPLPLELYIQSLQPFEDVCTRLANSCSWPHDINELQAKMKGWDTHTLASVVREQKTITAFPCLLGEKPYKPYTCNLPPCLKPDFSLEYLSFLHFPSVMI